MAAAERPVVEVLHDIIHNMREMVRAEVRLIRAEVRDEAARVSASSWLLVAGALAAILAVVFLLLMVVYALSMVIPDWAAALAVGGALALAAAVMIPAGLKQFSQALAFQPKEHDKWAKPPAN